MVGIAGYKSADWPRSREFKEDADKLPATCELWLQIPERAVKSLEKVGLVPVKAEVDPEVLVAWSGARNLKVDTIACTRYANERAHEFYVNGRS